MSRRPMLLPILLAICPIPHAQQPAAVHYDTVSIHESHRNADGSITMSGGIEDPHIARVTFNNWTFDNIVTESFGIAYYQLEGVPDALKNRYFVVRAQSGDETNALLKPMTDAEAKTATEHMLQEVLADRFKFQSHFITREEPAFLLTVDRKPLLHSSAAHPLVPGDERKRDYKDPTQPSMSERCDMRGCTLTAHGQSMEWLGTMLAMQLQGPVADHTSLSGLWDFTLKWSTRRDPNAATDDELPRLEDALKEQLGLKIERGKAPLKILVIDHAEAPTPN